MKEGNLNMMSLRDEELFYKKVCELHVRGKVPNCLKQIDAETESYYEERKSVYEGIQEYDISSVPALRNELQILWSDSELKELTPNIIASAFKAKERLIKESQAMEINYEGELPQYIYNF